MMWELPISVKIDGNEYAITEKCDYKMVLTCIGILKDENFSQESRYISALNLFYEDLLGCKDYEKAIKEMLKIISNGENQSKTTYEQPLIDWEHDFKLIAPAVSNVLGYDVRLPDKYTHWWTFQGGFMETKRDSLLNTVISIRSKLRKHKKLEDHEREFYIKNRDLIDLPLELTEEEKEWLNSDW